MQSVTTQQQSRKLLALVYGAQQWRHYLEGPAVQLHTDHEALTWLPTQPGLSRRQARWMEILSRFRWCPVYVKGDEDVVADALSRALHLPDPEILSGEQLLAALTLRVCACRLQRRAPGHNRPLASVATPRHGSIKSACAFDCPGPFRWGLEAVVCSRVGPHLRGVATTGHTAVSTRASTAVTSMGAGATEKPGAGHQAATPACTTTTPTTANTALGAQHAKCKRRAGTATEESGSQCTAAITTPSLYRVGRTGSLFWLAVERTAPLAQGTTRVCTVRRSDRLRGGGNSDVETLALEDNSGALCDPALPASPDIETEKGGEIDAADVVEDGDLPETGSLAEQDASLAARERLAADLFQRIKLGNEEDQWLQRHLTEPKFRTLLREHQGLLWYDGKLYVPDVDSLRQNILYWHHDVPWVAHRGIETTLRAVHTSFWWPTIKEDVANYVRTCHGCQESEIDRRSRKPFLSPLPTPQSCWRVLGVDLIVDLPKTPRGNSSVIVFVHLSKMCILVACQADLSTEGFADAFFCNVFRHY